MKAEDLELNELVKFSEGNIDLYGRRLVLHSINAFGQFRHDLIDMLGFEQARRVFTRFGFFWGQADAGAMRRVLEWDEPEELIKAGPKVQAMMGIVLPEIKMVDMDLKNRRFSMEVVWKNSAEAEIHLTEIGWSQCPVCWKLVGYASGYASYCLGENIYFIEDRCRAKGDDVCSARGKDKQSWGEEIKEHLPYFESDDIKGKVSRLTKELQKKTRELTKHQEKLAKINQIKSEFFIGGSSKKIEDVYILADRVARFDSSVLITGETGVGKEILAKYIHENSKNAEGAFVAVNCGALTESILESELFGHKKGSFTGAVNDRIGLFEQAARGTIFLDEIGDISSVMQMKLLRVLQEKEIMRVGESKPRKVNVRIIAATNKDLDQDAKNGRFREDLLYRLKVIEIKIPPLRERKEDILLLARFLVDKLSKRMNMPSLHLDSTCIDYLHSYPWPGNIRELENAIERMIVLSKGGILLPENLPPNIRQEKPIHLIKGAKSLRTLDQIEREYIEHVLRSTDGNKTHAAKILGIGQATLWRKLKQTGSAE
ncbi:sigma-54-dependent Fis family transcriptional regulator [bacterium]|nr:sigma-54-dependent Fis family transcriptional regulator [candidate division CSSED10-310 bacterium]